MGEGTSFPCSPCGPPRPAHYSSDGSEEQSGAGKLGHGGGDGDKGLLGTTGGCVPVPSGGIQGTTCGATGSHLPGSPKLEQAGARM